MSSPALEVSLSSVVTCLEPLEALPEDATGALYFGERSQRIGAVLVERGRVCWAMSQNMNRRLTDILRHQTDPPLAQEVVEQVYERCRKETVPLGQALVASGVVTDQGLRSALRQHNAEAIAMLSSHTIETEWQPHSKCRYDARYTFSTVELLASFGALRDGDLATRARIRLKSVLDAESYGIAFLREGASAPILVGAVGADGVPVAAVAEMGRWITGSIDLSRAVNPRSHLIALTCRSGQAVIVWPEGPIVYAALCVNSKSLARTLTRATRAPSS